MVTMTHHASFYIGTVKGLALEKNIDAYMYYTKDFAKGDKVKVCLIELPEDCPPGDDRGKTYAITNYKNKHTFTGTPDWHSCGGA